MRVLQTLGLWAKAPLQQLERVSFRNFGAARFASTHTYTQSEISDGGHARVNMVQPSVGRNRFVDIEVAQPLSQFQKKSRSYWSAIAVGLLGATGVSFIFDGKDESFKNLFTVQCACGCDDPCKPKPKDPCEKPKEDCAEQKCEISHCQKRCDCDDALASKANEDLEKALKDTRCKVIKYVEEALQAYCEAIRALNEFMSKVYCAAEEGNLENPRFDQVWGDVYSALNKRCELSKIANEKGACAMELLKRFRELIEQGKACKYTSCNPLLATNEDTLNCAEKELCAKKTEFDTLLLQSRPVEQYRNVIEDFRRDLKAEADSLIVSEDCKVTFNPNETNMVLSHAYKTILRIQAEMANCKKPEKEEEECW